VEHHTNCIKGNAHEIPLAIRKLEQSRNFDGYTPHAIQRKKKDEKPSRQLKITVTRNITNTKKPGNKF